MADETAALVLVFLRCDGDDVVKSSYEAIVPQRLEKFMN
jgi:hypothetical protein